MSSKLKAVTLKRKLLACLIISLSLSWTSSLKAEPDLGFHYDLDRQQGEKIVTCFEEQAACQETLKKMPEADHSETVLYATVAFFVGLVVGAASHH